MKTGAMEIDPNKLEESGTDREVNTLQLWLIAQKLFNAILKSQNDDPEEIRVILQHVYTTVEYRHDALSAYRAMGAFFHLAIHDAVFIGTPSMGYFIRTAGKNCTTAIDVVGEGVTKSRKQYVTRE
eukprot:TRINITY_DN20299_c0_g1_i1.p1 TRINITY_DN20299_c0_g1~~TRINITY_DN20299_c0_g1_i1.p1  ORF type:complete len:144 (-),score=22.83 TRINITY_DN20299_c0_g1_i1:262-639(-)